jgi:alkanesulfonate monooxygenase SsuD/methylene tetrahydromethanopterin reductase-like flavin-dependent oxidoreductase (luciferase family)
MGGGATPTLRVVAEHADLWNIPGGGDIDDLLGRSVLLDRFCAEIGRDPAEITRSIHLPVDYDRAAATRDAIGAALEAGFGHVILGLAAPYPTCVARWVADEVITPVRGRATAATP